MSKTKPAIIRSNGDYGLMSPYPIVDKVVIA